MDKNVLKNISYGLYVIGWQDEIKGGCIVNTVMQITSEPLTIALSINHDNYSNEVIKKTGKFSISILKENSNPKIIGEFGYKSSKEINKFANFDYEEKDNLPYLTDSCGNMICEVVDTYETQTHTLFIAKIKDMFNFSKDKPLTYKFYQEVLKGKSPKNAPTYIKEDQENKKNIWKCSICGYEIEKDNLPDDFVCPICGASKEVFQKIE